MIIKKWCDEEDCPNYPGNNYIEPDNVIKTLKINEKFVFNSDNLSIPMECLVCSNFKPQDMKKVLLTNLAKKELLK